MRKISEIYNKILKLKRYSSNTEINYQKAFQYCLRCFSNRDIDKTNKSEIQEYLFEQNEKGISPSLQNQCINTIKIYYEKVLERQKEVYDLPLLSRQYIGVDQKLTEQFYNSQG